MTRPSSPAASRMSAGAGGDGEGREPSGAADAPWVRRVADIDELQATAAIGDADDVARHRNATGKPWRIISSGDVRDCRVADIDHQQARAFIDEDTRNLRGRATAVAKAVES